MTSDAQVRAPASSCVHHWMIEAPSGRESTGVCRRCGATKNFANSTESVMWEQTNTLRSPLGGRGVRIARPSDILLSDEVSDED